MHSLYVDSTSGLTIGLLDPNFSWVEYINLTESRPSEIIHHEIFNLLRRHNLNLKNIRCFVSSGPGSYTGMRLSEGLAQIFELGKMKVYSFYHFDVPSFIGIDHGFWVTNAFKGQVFIHTWKNETIEYQLVSKESFSIENKELGFTLDSTDPLFSDLITTKFLIKEKSNLLFSKILKQQLRVTPYYFRTLDEEFR